VDELDARVAALSARRRKLLRRLAARQPEVQATGKPDSTGPSATGIPLTVPGISAFYDAITARLDATPVGPWSVFLNYGYCDGSNDQSVVTVPEHVVDRTSVKLVVELVGDCPIDGCHVLDVGCGRGGTVATLLRYYNPGVVVGVDLSPAAISFCRRSQPDRRARFEVGDAQCLTFPDSSFDIVTNLESSHCYPDVGTFYAGVRRVLRPGGTFLYTDLLTTSSLPARRAALAQLGLQLESERDVTPNVLRSCDLVAARRFAAFAGTGGSELDDFLAVPGSVHYKRMQSGDASYVMWRLKVPS
jgi:SAM-dependent methyltransferase